MRRRVFLFAFSLAISLAASFVATYLAVLRPMRRSWGVDPDEVAQPAAGG